MWPRVSRAEFAALEKVGRKRAFRKIVKSDAVPGLLAYEDGKAVAWVAVGPRRDAAHFNAAKTSKVDEEGGDDLYAITCFYVRNGHRKQGLMKVLAEAAIAHAK